MTVATLTRRRPAAPFRDLRMLAHQIGYEQLSFWRNPQAAVFTFAFPVVFVLILGALLHGIGATADFGGLSPLQYYVPTIAALSVLGSCYGQLAVALASRRQSGVLKRVRATPLPAWAYFCGLVVHCMLVSVVDMAVILGIGRLFGVALPSDWLAVAVTMALGAASFCALGVAVASLISNAEAAPAVAQIALLPLLFLSGTYMPTNSEALNRATEWLPVRPFNEALTSVLVQHSNPGWQHLAVLTAWGCLGAVVAVRRFRWAPRPE